MSKKSGNVVTDSESSTSQSDDEQKPETKERSRKPRETRGPGQKKRLAESEGATSSGIVLQPSHASKKDYTDQDIQSPAKRTKSNLQRTDAFDESGCSCGEDSSHAPTCSMSNLKLKDESAGKKDNVASSEAPGGCSSSAAGLEQYPKMDHLSVPVQSSGAQPTSPKKKGGLKGILCGAGEKLRDWKDTGKKAWNYIAVSPKHSPDKKKSSSDKTDPNLKRRSQRIQLLNQGASSSSSSISKKGDSSPDRSLPSTSSSDPNAERHKPANKNPYKLKSRAEPSSASTSDDSQQRVQTLNVPSGSGGHHSGQSSRSPSPGQSSRSPSPGQSSRSPSPGQRSQSRCRCKGGPKKYGRHGSGCPLRALLRQRVNNRSAKNSPPYKKSGESSSTASEREFSRKTRSISKSKTKALPMASTRDAFPPETPRFVDLPLQGSSPSRSDEAARSRRSSSKSPNRPGPSRCDCTIRGGQHDDSCPCFSAPRVTSSPFPRRRYPIRPSAGECSCSDEQKRTGQHDYGCPCWSSSS